MSRGFQVGDLALIKSCKTWPPAIGRCVTLIAFIRPGEDATYDGRLFMNTGSVNGWLVEHPEGFPTHSALFGLMPNRLQAVALFSEHLLTPLKGDEDPLQVKQKEIEHA